MQAQITEHQLSAIISHIAKEYTTYAPVHKDGELFFDKIKKPNLIIPVKKASFSFKKALWPNGLSPKINKEKTAFIGLPNCDARALELFIGELSHTDLLPRKENIFVLSAECEADESCFCNAFETKKKDFFDLHVQREKSGLSIFSGTQKGINVLKAAGIQKSLLNKHKIKEPVPGETERLQTQKLSEAIENFELNKDFWQKIANNCFGCGSCTAVCPLCFCIKQEESNDFDGSSEVCLHWDSCFSKSFSEIQNHVDLRPKRLNRLYNWYHHKFVRAYRNKKHFLCTGCGRCVKNCPAHLNQHKIISTIIKQDESADE